MIISSSTEVLLFIVVICINFQTYIVVILKKISIVMLDKVKSQLYFIIENKIQKSLKGKLILTYLTYYYLNKKFKK